MTSITVLGRVMNVMANNERNLEKVADLQADLSSGKRVRQMSDDPIAGRRALILRVQQFRGESFTTNIDRSLSTLNVTDSVMEEMSQLMDNVRSVAVQGANATQDDASREALADALEADIERLVDLANTRHEGRQLFAGTDVLQRPFRLLDDGSEVVYDGNLDDFTVNISPTSRGVVNRNGYDLFKNNVDVFQPLIDLRDALRNNDGREIGELITTIEEAHAQVTSVQGDLGGRVQRFELTRTQLEEVDLQLQTLISEQVDTDLATTIQELQSAQVALEAGLQTSVRVLQPTLLDFL